MVAKSSCPYSGPKHLRDAIDEALREVVGFAFLVVTIAAKRLEMSHLMRRWRGDGAASPAPRLASFASSPSPAAKP